MGCSKYYRFLSLIALMTLLSVNVVAKSGRSKELRGVWIATVNNIDWPSSPNLSSAEQKKELIDYLDLFKKLHINAVFLQVRLTADAFYRSSIEPWSIYLTGDQSKAPHEFYDPLEFAIEECHKRGMELHAWLNPYRVSQDTANVAKFSPDHIFFKDPLLFVRHGKKLYFDPAYPQTRDFLCSVVKDIVTRYDVDGIHLDDYFYPNNDFDDSVSFSLLAGESAKGDRAAWRRANVDLIVKMLNDTIKSVRPNVMFGISPYAVWRNKREDSRGSDTKSYGYTNYDHLHADILKWMECGWVDYIMPQLYFDIGYENADFAVLARWWRDNSNGVELYAGLGTYKLDADAKRVAWRSSAEIGRQIDLIRKIGGYEGFCFFSAKNLRDNVLKINRVVKKKFTGNKP